MSNPKDLSLSPGKRVSSATAELSRRFFSPSMSPLLASAALDPPFLLYLGSHVMKEKDRTEAVLLSARKLLSRDLTLSLSETPPHPSPPPNDGGCSTNTNVYSVLNTPCERQTSRKRLPKPLWKNLGAPMKKRKVVIMGGGRVGYTVKTKQLFWGVRACFACKNKRR